MIMSDGTRHQNKKAENKWKACTDFANGEMSLEVPENFAISETNLMPSPEFSLLANYCWKFYNISPSANFIRS